MNLRAVSARILYPVLFEGTSLSDALSQPLSTLADRRDQAFVQAICYGVCRSYYLLDALLAQLLDKPLKEKDQDVQSLLLVGLYQLTEMRVPPHAAVSETVDALNDLKKAWAKGLVNAVLRNYQRQSEALTTRVNKDSVALFSHPAWIIKQLKKDWPDAWESILSANNQHPPMVLRVNQQRTSRDAYLAELVEQEIEACAVEETSAGIMLAKPIDVQELPHFKQGYVSVQDGAAQLAAELLQLESGQHVLDACAAPGGKTAHILELQPNVENLVAIDCDAERMKRVQENLQRLQLTAATVCADAGNPAKWWDGKLFDRILLDAPCSASGVIRRHPDIKLLRRENDISKLAQEQLRLLTALWPLLQKNGVLLYATCSVFAAENTEVMQQFLTAQPDAKEEKIAASWGRACSVGRQILPGMHGMDGFYFACLRKG